MLAVSTYYISTSVSFRSLREIRVTILCALSVLCGLKKRPEPLAMAATYSPTQLPVQYHRRRRA